VARHREARFVGVAVAASALVAAAAAPAAVGPRLSQVKLRNCILLHAGQPDTGGVRSMGYTFAVDQDPNVVGLVLVSGANPRPSLPTKILTTGRTPLLTKRFANVRIDAFVFHRNGVKPRTGATTAMTKQVTKVVSVCTAAAR
jgi:hypothetical protein